MPLPGDLSEPAIVQLHWLSTGAITSLELLDAYVHRYERLNGPLNAIVAVDLDGARQQAREVDRKRAAGEPLGALGGLPMTIKDVFDVDRLPAVAGVPKLAKRGRPVVDAAMVARLREADAVIWGKTNTPLMAGDVQTYNKVYGVTNNPFDVSRTPGGSSGGAAAALAVGMTPLEVGSDIGGSLRTPAHNCGVCALKPTYGLLSLQGHVPPSPGIVADDPDLAVAGPMARNVEDLALLFSVLAPDQPAMKMLDSLAGISVARWVEPEFSLGDEANRAVEMVGEFAVTDGATVTVQKPSIVMTQLIDVYIRLLLPIITAEVPSVARRILKLARPLAARRARPGVISIASSLAALTQSDATLQQAQQDRAKMKAACEAFFQDVDVLIAPVTAVPAIPHNTKGLLYRRTIDVDGETVPYTSQFQWISLATVCHLPAVVIPVMRSAEGLPLGVQIIGREGADREVLEIAQRLVAGLDP